MSRALRSLAATLVAVTALVGCCPGGTCIKDPPCKRGEDPCCLSPIQKKSLEAKTHALPTGPVAYTYEEKTYILLTEKGVADFEKDPGAFEEKGATRLIRKGKTYRVDLNPGSGNEPDWAAIAAGATPFVWTPPPKKK